MRHLIVLPLILCLPGALCAATLRTSDGLALELADDGQVAGLSLLGRPVPVTSGGGFYVAEVGAAGPDEGRHPLRCPILPDSGMFIQKQRFDDLGLTFETSYAGAGEYLSFSAKLTDHTGRDRPVEAGFEIPLEAGGWTWGDDLLGGRRITEAICYRSVRPCDAGPGYVQPWPFCALSKGAAGLSLGVPLSQGPRVFAVEYDHARRRLAIRFHLGLSPRVKKLPGQAWFSFLLYAHDGLWGMRSAADRYARLFPEDFARRAPHEGYVGCLPGEACDGRRTPVALYDVPALGDFGGSFGHAMEVSRDADAQGLAQALDDFEAREPRREPYRWCLTVADDPGSEALSAAPEAIAASEAPLSYLHTTRQVCSVDGPWRRQTKLIAPLAEQRHLLVARRFAADGPGFCAQWPSFDLGLVSLATPSGGEALFRAAAGRRLLRFWSAPGQDTRGEAPLREMLYRGLPYAIYPHLQPDAPQQRNLYLQFVPVIERLSAAGWEPLTLARAPAPELLVERYGRLADSNLCLAVRNVGQEPLATTVALDPALGLPAAPSFVQAMDLVADAPVAATVSGKCLAVPVRLAPGEATALLVLPTERYCQRALLDAAEALQQATPLTSEEVSVQPSRPGEVLAGGSPAGVRAATILCDGWTTDQGLLFAPGEPLTLSLDLNAPHRLQWLRMHTGAGEGCAAPEAVVEGVDREGTWHKLATLPAVGRAGELPAPIAIKDEGEYQRLRLVYPELRQRLWLTEIEVAGQDAALTRAADRFRSLAASGCRDFGVISQLAMVLRVRRMLGHDRTLQERALTALADFCRATSGVAAAVEVPAGAPRSGPAKAQLVVANRGAQPLKEGSVKLKLPPGWSAAPGKFAVNLGPGEAVRLPVTLSRPPEGGRLTLLVTGVVDGTPLFMSRQQ
ncbi:NEW3 domain-containing protein [bacterium]|nr:NEW3 domain-containing protein [bacterium]